MSDKQFVHLHCHTHYSLLDGANHIEPLVKRAKELGMDSLAFTDHGNMFATVEFYTKALDAGVKPIIGCEVYVAGNSRFEKTGGTNAPSHHLILLASNKAGYRNLIKLVSQAYLEGFYYRPRIDRELLGEHQEGLIVIDGHMGTDLADCLGRGDPAGAEQAARWYREVFGPERFYIELQRHGQADQERINPLLIDLAGRLKVPLVATNDVHYLTRDDAFAQEVMICINTGKTLGDENPLKHETQEFYLKSPEEMAFLFRDHPEAIENTVRIAEQCNVVLDFKSRHAPVFHPPGGKAPDEYLREQVYARAAEKYGRITPELRERIDYELGVIASKGFSSYFLIVWDFVQFARSRGIPCGARGSGCSTVIGYCLGLSTPDPIRYGLYFERFMDPERDELPDIDIDMCQNGRADVIEYVRKKYGHVAQIITFGTLKAKAAIRDVCRVMGVPLPEADKLAKLVPEELKMTLDKALAREPELKRFYEEDERYRKVIDVARRLEGMARHASVHAAGVVVADKPLTDFLPLCKVSDNDHAITQFDGTAVEKIGLLKMDFLGLRTLTILERAKELADRRAGSPIDLSRIDLEDQRVYEVFSRGQTKGIFQFESGGMRDVLMKMRPNRIEDLIAANALFRPGPMVNIEAYVARKHGQPWSTPHPIMTEVLQETYGIMVYQEQVSRLVNRLGGLELKRAFRLAKAISKKKTSMIEAERQPFVDGAISHGVRQETAEKVFEDILRFGGYAFNKAHSTGYALVAFETAYMKTYWPVEFMAALLTYEIPAAKPDDRGLYIDECRRMDIAIRPPDINQSEADFTVVYESLPADGAVQPSRVAPGPVSPSDRRAYIRFGLAGIKGVGEAAVHAIMHAREEHGPFKDIFDFCEHVDTQKVNKAVIEALIKAGAFDSTGAMRRALMEVLDRAMQMGAEAQRDRRDGQLTMFGDFGSDGAQPAEKIIGSSEWSESEMLAHEKEALGFYVTSHPLSQHADLLRRFTTADVADLRQPEFEEGSTVVLGGMITRIRTVVTKAGRNPGAKMGIVALEDLTGSIEVVLFPDDLEKYRPLLGADRLALICGQVDRRREEPSVRVSEVIPVDQAIERLAVNVLIKLHCVGTEEKVLQQVQDVCRAHPGQTPLIVQLITPTGLRVSVKSRQPAGVKPDEALIRDVTALLGEDHLLFEGPPRRGPRRPLVPQATGVQASTAEPPEPPFVEEEAEREVYA
jgi:DNA polymerase-3 subunit alpha